jgi:ribonuclease HI
LDYENTFQHLNKLLTSAPILRIADPNEDFIAFLSLCKEGLGGVLSQNQFVVCYESRKLKEHERNYATNDLELEAIVHALRKWRNYLMGKMFELRTDHNGLKYLFDQTTLNAWQRRWLEFISEYDFDIKNIKGKENQVANSLSRRVCELNAKTISMYQSYLKDKILEVAKSDLQYKELVEKLQQGILQQKIEDYKIENDEILIYRGRIYVANS